MESFDMHNVPILLISYLIFYIAHHLFLMILRLVVPSARDKAEAGRELKRLLLGPACRAVNDLPGRPAPRKRLLLRACFLAVILLFSLEAYRFTGLDLTPGSYTEFPHAYCGMYVMVNYDGSSKYYKLPAQIVRDDDDHVVTRAWWPNGGYIDFQNLSEPLKVELNQTSSCELDERSYTVLLTGEPVTDNRILYTVPSFSAITLIYILAALYLLPAFTRFRWPRYEYDDQPDPPIPSGEVDWSAKF